MKKILFATLAITLGTFVAFSQNLSLVYEGNTIPANHTIGFWGPPNGDEMVIEIEVTNNSNSEMDVLAKKVENSIIPETVNTFCWAGQCYPPFVYVSPNATTIPSGGTTAVGEFSGHYNPMSIPGQSSISYVFYDMNNLNDSVMVTVLFFTSTVGLTLNDETEFSISDPYPNPASHFVKFDYELDQVSNASLRVYSLIGSLVKEVSITQSSGTVQIETGLLQEGFYFYTLSSTGKELKTGRFIISR